MLSAGARLGTYEVVSLLGSGGMGEVYRAAVPQTLDPRWGRPCRCSGPYCSDPFGVAPAIRRRSRRAAVPHGRSDGRTIVAGDAASESEPDRTLASGDVART